MERGCRLLFEVFVLDTNLGQCYQRANWIRGKCSWQHGSGAFLPRIPFSRGLPRVRASFTRDIAHECRIQVPISCVNFEEFDPIETNKRVVSEDESHPRRFRRITRDSKRKN